MYNSAVTISRVYMWTTRARQLPVVSSARHKERTKLNAAVEATSWIPGWPILSLSRYSSRTLNRQLAD